MYCLPESHLLHYLFDCQVILLGGHTGLSPFWLGASCIRMVFHRIFGASFRSRQFSWAPFPIKIPFHKTAFTNSLSGSKSSGLSSLVHCFPLPRLLKLDSSADLRSFPPRSPSSSSSLSISFPTLTSSKPPATRYSCVRLMSLKQKALFIPKTSGKGYTVQLPPENISRTEFLLLSDVSYRRYRHHFPTSPCCMQGPGLRYQFSVAEGGYLWLCNQPPSLHASNSPRSQEPAQTLWLYAVPRSRKPWDVTGWKEMGL